MERYFVNTVKKYLKSSIKSETYVHIADDTLIVDIITNKSLCYRYTLTNLTEALIYNVSAEIVANEIVTQYKKKILDLYFYE